MTVVKLFAVLIAHLGFLGIIFDIVIAIFKSICIYHGHTLEKCPFNSLPQGLGSFHPAIEAFKSIFLTSALFLWRRFSTRHFFLALARVGHFWVWFVLCILAVVTISAVKSVESRDEHGRLSTLGVFLVVEVISLTLFASAINFVARETYESWAQQQTSSQSWQRFFRFLYFLTLTSYLMRNFEAFLYDTALVSLSISLVSGTSHKTGHWDGLLLVLMAAFRGSFVKFFFAKLFQGQDLPTVCDNVPKQTVALSYIDTGHQDEASDNYRFLDAVTSQESSMDIPSTSSYRLVK